MRVRRRMGHEQFHLWRKNGTSAGMRVRRDLVNASSRNVQVHKFSPRDRKPPTKRSKSLWSGAVNKNNCQNKGHRMYRGHPQQIGTRGDKTKAHSTLHTT